MFKPTSEDNEKQAIQELENCALNIDNWMKQNKLKMNSSKTEFILFGSRHQLKKCSVTELNVASDNIKYVSCTRYLGAYLDENLSFKDHINENVRPQCSIFSE